MLTYQQEVIRAVQGMSYSHTHLQQKQRVSFVSKVTLGNGSYGHHQQPDRISQSIKCYDTMRPLSGKTRDEVSISCLASLLCNPSPWRNLYIGTYSIPRFDSPVVMSSTYVYLQPHISTIACIPTPPFSARYKK
jgi:hypothetical protein